MQYTYGSATLNLSTHVEDYEPEMLGEGEWTFQWREVKRIAKKLPRFLDSNVCGDLRTMLDEAEMDVDPEELGEHTFTVAGDADAAIAIVCAMFHLGGSWDVHYNGHGSEYWVWHDICHAQYDFGVDFNDGSVDAWIDESGEERAMLEGAKLAKAYGVSMGDIARQLVKAEQEWSNRAGFNGTPYFLEQFLDD